MLGYLLGLVASLFYVSHCYKQEDTPQEKWEKKESHREKEAKISRTTDYIG